MFSASNWNMPNALGAAKSNLTVVFSLEEQLKACRISLPVELQVSTYHHQISDLQPFIIITFTFRL